jgi:hypothetical protein
VAEKLLLHYKQIMIIKFDTQIFIIVLICHSKINFTLPHLPHTSTKFTLILSRQFNKLTLYFQVVIFDMDKGEIVRKVGDEDSILPKKYSKCLKQALEISMRCEDNNLVISEAFIRLFIELIGHFRQHIMAVPNETTMVFHVRWNQFFTQLLV